MILGTRGAVTLIGRERYRNRTCDLFHAKGNIGKLQQEALVVVIKSRSVDTTDGPANVGMIELVSTRDIHIADVMTPSGVDDFDELSECACWLQGKR